MHILKSSIKQSRVNNITLTSTPFLIDDINFFAKYNIPSVNYTMIINIKITNKIISAQRDYIFRISRYNGHT